MYTAQTTDPKKVRCSHTGLARRRRRGLYQTLGDANGELDGPVDGSDDEPEEGTLLLTLGDADGELEGPVDGSVVGPEEGALLKLGLLEDDEDG